MDKVLYREILQDNFLGTLDDLDLYLHDCYFQQDKDPKHTPHIVKDWFRDNNVDVLPWPASSPDMSIIKHVWDHLDRMVRARRPPPSGEEELWRALQEEWARMDEAYIAKLYQSMSRRVRTLYEAKGGNTRY
jgi:hypothetical protein